MSTALLSATALRWFDHAGVLVFALSGASLAARKHFDVVGVAVLAGATGLGGGIVRDVLLGDTPPRALSVASYLLLPLIATMAVMAVHRWVLRLGRIVAVFDAAGLGLFALTGAVRTLDQGHPWWTAVLLGAISAVGGGVIRDVLARDVPLIFRPDSELLAIPATAAAAVSTLCWHLEMLNPLVATAIVAITFITRLLALRHTWTAPVPRGLSV